MSEEALKAAYGAKNIFAGVNDSFGQEISSDVIDEILSSLHAMNSMREDASQIKNMLLERLQQSHELGTIADAIEV